MKQCPFNNTILVYTACSPQTQKHWQTVAVMQKEAQWGQQKLQILHFIHEVEEATYL